MKRFLAKAAATAIPPMAAIIPTVMAAETNNPAANIPRASA
jgi:hypothetical protein